MNVQNFRNDKIYFETPNGKLVERAYTKGANKGKIYFRIDWAPGFAPRFTKAFTTVQAMFAQEAAKKMDAYIPFATGILKNSVFLASDFENGELVYNTPYARRQYYLHPQGQGIHDGHRGSHWAERCDADNHAYFVRFVRKAAQKEVGQ